MEGAVLSPPLTLSGVQGRREIQVPEGRRCLPALDDNKVKAAYHLCIFHEIFYSEGGVVRTVTVGYRPRRLCGGGKDYKPSPLEIIPVGIQILVLLCPAEELSVKTDEENLGDENEPADLKSLATEASRALNYEEASELTTAEDTTTDNINAEVNLNFAEEVTEEPNYTKEASEKEVDTKEASEDMVAEDVFADDFAKDLADDFAKDLADDFAKDLTDDFAKDLADDFAKDLAVDSAEVLEAELEE